MSKQRRNKLLEKPKVREKLDAAVHIGQIIKARNPGQITGFRDLLGNEEVRAAMEDILEVSAMPETTKIYIRSIFIDKLSKRKAIKKAFGKDLGYQEEAIAGSIMENPVVKEFVDLIKQFYVQVAPIAALKEVDILLNPKTDPEIALKAAKQIKEGAGIGVEQKGTPQLPVKIVINMPGAQPQTNTQIIMPKIEEVKK